MRNASRIEQLELQLKEEREIRNEVEMVQRIIRVGLEALSLRMLTTLVLLADCVLFAWALSIGTWQSLVTAIFFAVSTWCVLNLKMEKKHEPADDQAKT